MKRNIEYASVLPSPGQTEAEHFFALTSQVLLFFEGAVWPLRLEKLLNSNWEQLSFEMKVEELKSLIESSPSIKDEWLGMAAPTKKEEGASPDSKKLSLIERIRLFGPTKTRAYFLGATLRHQTEFSTKEKLDWINNPLPTWQIFSRIFQNEESSAGLQIECTLLFEIFLCWLKISTPPANSSRAKRWIEKEVESWARLWTYLQKKTKQGASPSSDTTFKTQLLFDLGRATGVALSDKAGPAWVIALKEKQALPLTLWAESTRNGYCSALLGAVWAQSFTGWSPLSTSLRLLKRPWRDASTSLHSGFSEVIDFLQRWNEGRIS